MRRDFPRTAVESSRWLEKGRLVGGEVSSGPSTLWAATTRVTHTLLQENKLLHVVLTCVFAGTIPVTPRHCASLNPRQRGGAGWRRLWQVWRRVSHTAPPQPRCFPSIYFCGPDCVWGEPCCGRDTPEEEETRWVIFHHYILHLLINEIQSAQTASLVDHHLRENHKPNETQSKK